MKTHKVLDLHYHEDEGQDCFCGTKKECEDFASTQTSTFMYKVVPMTKEEIETYPDNQEEILAKKEEDITSSTNSEVGSSHWFRTIVSNHKHIGEYLKNNTPTEEILRDWGQKLHETSDELLKYHALINKQNDK